jgi:3-hydroxyacyl-[acyl-carrier-protein] dehydratase
MAPKIIYEIGQLNLDHAEYGIEEIHKVNPQRFEFEQLNSIIKFSPDEGIIVGCRMISLDEFWVRGHIPGRPIFPGVLMVEAAAQLCSFYYAKYFKDNRFFGFGGLDKVKFRGTVSPGDRLILLAKAEQLHPRRSVFYTQGLVQDKLVFEAEIAGVSIGSMG